MPKPMIASRWLELLCDDCGVTSIEYALLGALIAMVIIGAVTSVGSSVLTLYQLIAAEVP